MGRKMLIFDEPMCRSVEITCDGRCGKRITIWRVSDFHTQDWWQIGSQCYCRPCYRDELARIAAENGLSGPRLVPTVKVTRSSDLPTEDRDAT